MFIDFLINIKLFRRLLHLFSLLVQVGSLRKRYSRSRRPEVLNGLYQKYSCKGGSSSLDLGSGPKPRNPFHAESIIGADIRSNNEIDIVYADFSLGYLPFDDNSFDRITAYDLIEHIQRSVWVEGSISYPFISLMNEIFRVLKPDGIFFCIQPCYPSKEAFQDPTHVNIMTEDTMYLYFCEPAWARIYGYQGSFKILSEGWLGEKFYAFMQKSSDKPILNLEHVQS